MSKKKVLIVDDEEIMRNFLFDLLKDEGYDVDQCSSGEDAIAMAKSKKYSLVISDIKMQGKNGYDVLNEVKKADHDIKVLMMTGYALDENGASSVSKGADGFLLKPFDITSIRQITQNLIGNAE